MTHTISLDEQDLKAAIAFWLSHEKGYSLQSVYFAVNEDDRTRSHHVTASVSVEELK